MENITITHTLPSIVGPQTSPPSRIPIIVGTQTNPPSRMPIIVESHTSQPSKMVPRPPQIPRGI